MGILGLLFCVSIVVALLSGLRRDSVAQNKFGPYMKQHHPEEWSRLCQYAGILNSRKGFGTKAVQDFIFKSTETFGDEMVETYRKNIKSLQRATLLCMVCAGLAAAAVFIINHYTG